jgi:hypothetical protein
MIDLAFSKIRNILFLELLLRRYLALVADGSKNAYIQKKCSTCILVL